MTDVTTKSVADFHIKYLQLINEDNEATQTLPDGFDEKTLKELYRLMALTRALDLKAINLQRTGKLGTYPSSRGQEAIGVGMGNALQEGDVFCPYYRDQGAFIARGNKLSKILGVWGGDEFGNDFHNPVSKKDFPICVPIGTQLLHATGVAFAMKYRKEQKAVLTICGDGGTSQGDFYEALNVAGEWQLPVVFVINNNQWAISVPRDAQSHCKTLAQKAIAGGFEGLQVDGNDVVAVRYAVDQALQKARNGGGPTLIEAVTYRLCNHTTADDATRYQSEEDVKAAWKKEPIARLGHYMEAQGWWSREKEAELQKEVTDELNQAVEEYLNAPEPTATDMFDYLYAELPAALKPQRDSLGEDA